MKKLLLTGASGGMGRAIIPRLYALGYELVLHANRGGADLRAYLEQQSIHAPVLEADLTQPEAVDAFIAKVKSYGPIEILVNNAGVAHASPAWKLAADEMMALMEANFFSAVRCTQPLLADMRLNGAGRVISISSVVAHQPSFGTSGYAASKSALEGYMRGIAIDVANKGITANTIAYGFMNAGMLREVPEPVLEQVKGAIPLGHFGDPEQVAYLIHMLVESPFTTGQTLHVNGGQWMP